jgi:acyl transferase domain-containing protein
LVTTFKQPQCFSPYTMQGGTLGNIANLVSFYLDLHGCSASVCCFYFNVQCSFSFLNVGMFQVDTACSSSLTALHLARQSLEAGELDAALVIGTNFLLQPDGFLGFGAAHMLSPTGQSRPFHKDANGFVRSEGCVAMLLVRERMAHALPYARLIRSGVNENGRNTSVTQPQVEAQRVLLEEVVFDTEAPRVAFIEAHGTGTAVGDPIESRSIADRFAPVVASTGRAPIPIGSAKAVFGHLETGSGLVGVLRAALALRFSTVFAQPQLDQSPATVNPAVVASFTSNGTRASPVYIPFNESALEQGYQGFAPLAVINSFGYGGANACVLLEQIPEPTSALEPAPAGMLPLYLRAVSAEHLQAIQASVSTQAPWTQNVAVRLNSATGSGSGLLDRVACVGALNAAGALKWNEVKISAADASQQPKIAYVFGGQGTQHPRMGIDLYRHVSAFRESIDRGDAAYLKLTGVSLKVHCFVE